jgi:hypothetical protein
MTRARQDGLCLLLLGSVVFLLLGTVMERSSVISMVDFKAVYYGAKCLVQHRDPYEQGEILRVYQADGGGFPSDPINSRLVHEAVLVFVNLPTTLLFLAPFTALAFGPAHLLWISLIDASLIVASLLIWDIGADFAPVLSGALIGILLANSEVLVMVGNTAGIVTSLCVVAVWCFLRHRFALIGILCLAVGMAIKPHDAVLVWLFFLLSGKVYRKRALQTLFAVAVFSLTAFLWAWHVAPHWIQELQSNLLATSASGAINDPALASQGQHALGMIINLQSAISVLWDDPRIYNPASYLLIAPLLLIWALVTLCFRSSPARAFLALAAIAALSMLPTYHRPYDAKLLLLTVPACAMLWAEGGLIGRLALAVNAAGFLVTGDHLWIALQALAGKFHFSAPGMAERLQTAMWVFPAPLILLVMGAFYLWVYVRRSSAQDINANGLGAMPEAPESS